MICMFSFLLRLSLLHHTLSYNLFFQKMSKPRCQDGTLDMRFGANRGLWKHLAVQPPCFETKPSPPTRQGSLRRLGEPRRRREPDVRPPLLLGLLFDVCANIWFSIFLLFVSFCLASTWRPEEHMREAIVKALAKAAPTPSDDCGGEGSVSDLGLEGLRGREREGKKELVD